MRPAGCSADRACYVAFADKCPTSHRGVILAAHLAETLAVYALSCIPSEAERIFDRTRRIMIKITGPVDERVAGLLSTEAMYQMDWDLERAADLAERV